MNTKPIDPSKARVLITNDDGVYAPGIKALTRVAEELFKEVWVVAPDRQQSGAGHSLTMHRPLRLKKVDDQVYAVDGTPTDCAMLAIKQLLKDNPPDIVISGVNNGINLGEDVMYSGTVAAAVEAVMLGVRSIALSLAVDQDQPAKWSSAEFHSAAIINKICSLEWEPGTLINVNFPNLPASDVKGTKITYQGQRETGDQIVQGTDPRGMGYYWIGPWATSKSTTKNSDLNAVEDGFISVTPLHMNMTHEPLLDTLTKVFSG